MFPTKTIRFCSNINYYTRNWTNLYLKKSRLVYHAKIVLPNSHPGDMSRIRSPLTKSLTKTILCSKKFTKSLRFRSFERASYEKYLMRRPLSTTQCQILASDKWLLRRICDLKSTMLHVIFPQNVFNSWSMVSNFFPNSIKIDSWNSQSTKHLV